MGSMGSMGSTGSIRAVFFDFGGVITSSPFEAFARYEAAHDLPPGFLRRLNSTNPHTNAWARFERNEVDFDGFAQLFEGEARAAGHSVNAREVVGLLGGTVRPEMVEAVRRCSERLATACLTNNFGLTADPRPEIAEILQLFDAVVESSRLGARKPDPEFYEAACREVDVTPKEVVFLDDLGVNLEPARGMGMTTIKVESPDRALDELEQAVGFPVRGVRGVRDAEGA